MGIEEVIIDARDITVEMVLKFGGTITGKKTNFYGYPITQWRFRKKILSIKPIEKMVNTK